MEVTLSLTCTIFPLHMGFEASNLTTAAISCRFLTLTAPICYGLSIVWLPMSTHTDQEKFFTASNRSHTWQQKLSSNPTRATQEWNGPLSANQGLGLKPSPEAAMLSQPITETHLLTPVPPFLLA